MKTASIVCKIIVIIVLIALLAAILLIPVFHKTTTQTEEIDSTGALTELTQGTINADISALSKNADDYRKLYLEASGKMDRLVTVEDLHLPEAITAHTKQPFGLFLYDGQKNALVPYTTEGLFDVNKKTLFFAHGMGRNGAFYNCKGYYESGYNVLCFQWGIFASEDIYSMISDKVWACDGNHRYRLSDETWVEGEELNHSVAEMYGAFYYDFLSRYPSYDSKEIVIGGHSYGGMLTTALLSYLTTAFRCGLLDARYLPDRVMLCDPFYRGGEEGIHIRWLGNLVPPTNGSLVAIAMQTIPVARQLGISVVLFRSSMIIVGPFELAFEEIDYGEEKLQEFYSSLFYVFAIANGMLRQDLAHNYGETWPAYTLWEVFDDTHPDEYAFSQFNPYHSEYAHMGESVTIDYHMTANNFKDDTSVLTNRTQAKLYGFAFSDDNGNGVMDERLYSHVRGAHIKIANADGTTVYEGTTAMNGYYEVNVQPGTYTVEVTAPDGYACASSYSVTVAEDACFVYQPIPMRKNA